MNQRPVVSWSQRAWSAALSLLGLAIVLNMAWALLVPLLPVLAGVAVLVAVVSLFNAWRWR